MDSHITNACAWNKGAAQGKSGFEFQSDAMRTLKGLAQLLANEHQLPVEQARERVEQVADQCHQIMASCFEAVLSEVRSIWVMA